MDEYARSPNAIHNYHGGPPSLLSAAFITASLTELLLLIALKS
jgi:hypothetical protein